MKFKYQRFIAAMLVAVMMQAVTSCNSDDPEPVMDDDFNMLAHATDTGTNITVTLYSKRPLFAGFNELKVLLERADKSILNNSDVTFFPLMKMATMSHSSPVDIPDPQIDDQGRYMANVVFVMPSGDMNSWTLEIKFSDMDNSISGSVIFDVNVVSPEEARVHSLICEDDGTVVYVSLINPADPQVGINDFEILINRKEGMMSWPADESFIIEIESEMPAMNHGSPNNVDPVHIAKGHYAGKVNFTMDGYWSVNLILKHENDLAGELSFDITF